MCMLRLVTVYLQFKYADLLHSILAGRQERAKGGSTANLTFAPWYETTTNEPSYGMGVLLGVCCCNGPRLR